MCFIDGVKLSREESNYLSMRGRKPLERPKTKADKYLINEQIRSAEVRVIGVDGEQIGVISTADALARAEEAGVDLVAVAPDSNPPVCRLLDYGKLKYKEQKKASEARKRTATNTVKEIRIRYSTEEHDLETKIRKATKFLENGDRVRFQMRFRGREAVYKDLGLETFERVKAALEEIAIVEDQSPLVGNRMILVMAPKGLK